MVCVEYPVIKSMMVLSSGVKIDSMSSQTCYVAGRTSHRLLPSIVSCNDDNQHALWLFLLGNYL